MRCRLRETTSVIVAVQQSPRLSVMLIDTGRGSSASAVTEVGRQFAVECCRDDVTSLGPDVDVPSIAKSHEAVAEFGFDADLENVCTSHDMTR